MNTFPKAEGLVNDRVLLRNPTPDDYPALYQIETTGWSANSWRYGGSIPSFDSYVQSLWASVLAQFIVEAKGWDRPVGLVSCYNADHANGIAYFAALKFSPDDTSSRMMDGIVLFIDWLFDCWPFRKLYIEASGHSLAAYQHGAFRHLTEEGRLKDRLWVNGKYEDLITLTLSKENWTATRPGAERELARALRGDTESVIQLIASMCDRQPEDLAPDARLVEDLEFDSILLVELAQLFEDAGLGRLPEQLDMMDITVRDVCHFASDWADGRSGSAP